MLVLESRTRVGSACTIEEPFPGVRMSPCSYLAGLLHPLVVSELDLPGRGFQWSPAINGLFVPFLDGSSIQPWDVCVIIALFMQDRGSDASKSMASHPAFIAHALERLQNGVVAHRLLCVAISREKQLAATGERVQRLQHSMA